MTVRRKHRAPWWILDDFGWSYACITWSISVDFSMALGAQLSIWITGLKLDACPFENKFLF